MKIAVIGPKGLPAKQGGIEHYCAEVYPRIVSQGHSVDLFGRSSYTDSSWFNSQKIEGIRVFSLPSLPLRGIDAFVTSALGAIVSTGTQYDIVHFHALGPSLFSCIPRISLNSKVVVTCQGLDWQRAKWGTISSNLIHMGEKTAVRFAHSIIVVSEELRSYFQKTYQRDTVYIPNGPASYPESDPKFTYGNSLGLTEGKYIVYLGRLVPEKRPDLLIESFQALESQGWKLVFVGGVSDTKPFVSKLLNIVAGNPNIIFAGELRGSRLAEIVRGAGLFVLPSDLEGLPLAMLEAMREGIPVLASDIPPHQQLIAGGKGKLFQAGNQESLTKGLHWAINNPLELTVMAKNAQRYVNTYYTWERITSENLKIYNSLLNTPIAVSS